MSTQYLDLGKAKFGAAKSNILLELTASAELRCDSGKPLSLNLSESGHFLGDAQDAWICKSHDFRLCFITSSDGDLLRSKRIEVSDLKLIEEVLKTAQLWEQLCLQPILVEQSTSHRQLFNSSNQRFVLAIHNDYRAYSPTDNSVSALATSRSDVANLRAPESVRTIRLVSVSVSLRFRVGPLRTDGNSCSFEMVNGLALTAFPSTDESQSPTYESSAQDRSKIFTSLLENDDLRPQTPRTIAFDPPRPGVAACTSQRQSSSKTVLQLADVAMRNLICGRPSRPLAAITPCDGSTLLNLTNLAPVVFTPGYADAVQARARFIPTIAKFLCKFLQHSKQERPNVHYASVGQTGWENDGTEENSQRQREAIQGHLWMNLTNGLRNTGPVPKLKPLHFGRTPGANETHVPSGGAFEDLLDSWSSDAQNDPTSYLQEDFEDLCLDRDDGFTDSEDDSFSDLYDTVPSSCSPDDDLDNQATEIQFDLKRSDSNFASNSEPLVSPTAEQYKSLTTNEMIEFSDTDSSMLFNHRTETIRCEHKDEAYPTDFKDGDHLPWQMLIERRSSMIQEHDDILEKQTVSSRDDDVRLLTSDPEFYHHDGGDLLEPDLFSGLAVKSASAESAATSKQRGFQSSLGQDQPTGRKYHDYLQPSKDIVPAESQRNLKRPNDGRQLGRGSYSLNQLPEEQAVGEATSRSRRALSPDESRDVEIKRRKPLVDHGRNLDEVMLLN